MREARKKLLGQGCYYHLMNRVSGPVSGYYPFTDVDKEYGIKLLQKAAKFFLVEVISASWMGNHFHLVVYAPNEVPSAEKVAGRYNRFYGKSKYIDATEVERCKQIGEQMIDISYFMKWYLQKYTCYFNRVHNHRGSLWADRFKSTIVQGTEALWKCVKYVELNPVRAGLTENPADYRFSTWGYFCGSGRPLFKKYFLRHMKRSRWGDKASNYSEEDLYSELRGELGRTIANESGLAGKALDEAIAKARKKESMPVRFLRRTRHWTDGVVIGSKSFVQETYCQFRDKEEVMRHKLSRGSTETGTLYCYRLLKKNV